MEQKPNFINENENVPERTLESLLEEVKFRSSEQLDKLKAEFIEAVNQGKMEEEEGKEQVAKLCGKYRSEFEKQADQISKDLPPEDKSYYKAQIGVEIHMALLFREAGLKEYELSALDDAGIYAQNMGFDDWGEIIAGERESLEKTITENDNPEQIV